MLKDTLTWSLASSSNQSPVSPSGFWTCLKDSPARLRPTSRRRALTRTVSRLGNSAQRACSSDLTFRDCSRRSSTTRPASKTVMAVAMGWSRAQLCRRARPSMTSGTGKNHRDWVFSDARDQPPMSVRDWKKLAGSGWA